MRTHNLLVAYPFCLIFALVLCNGAHAQTAPQFDAVEALKVLPELVQNARSSESGQTMSEEVTVIKEVINQTTEQALKQWEEKSINGAIGYGPFKARISKEEARGKIEQLKSQYSSATSDEEFRKRFAENSRQYLSGEALELVKSYLKTVEVGIFTQPQTFFRIIVAKATAEAISIRISWPDVPNGQLYGARITGIRLNGKDFRDETLLMSGKSTSSPYAFTIPRPAGGGEVLVNVEFTVDGMGGNRFSPDTLFIEALGPTADDIKKKMDQEVNNLAEQVKTARDEIAALKTDIANLNARALPSGVMLPWNSMAQQPPEGWTFCAPGFLGPNLVGKIVGGNPPGPFLVDPDDNRVHRFVWLHKQ